jgi:hypothetical protein
MDGDVRTWRQSGRCRRPGSTPNGLDAWAQVVAHGWEGLVAKDQVLLRPRSLGPALGQGRLRVRRGLPEPVEYQEGGRVSLVSIPGPLPRIRGESSLVETAGQHGRSRGRRAAIALLVATVAAAAVSAYLGRSYFEDSWWMWKLHSRPVKKVIRLCDDSSSAARPAVSGSGSDHPAAAGLCVPEKG